MYLLPYLPSFLVEGILSDDLKAWQSANDLSGLFSK